MAAASTTQPGTAFNLISPPGRKYHVRHRLPDRETATPHIHLPRTPLETDRSRLYNEMQKPVCLSEIFHRMNPGRSCDDPHHPVSSSEPLVQTINPKLLELVPSSPPLEGWSYPDLTTVNPRHVTSGEAMRPQQRQGGDEASTYKEPAQQLLPQHQQQALSQHSQPTPPLPQLGIPPRRGRGRPPGSKNKIKATGPRTTALAETPSSTIAPVRSSHHTLARRSQLAARGRRKPSSTPRNFVLPRSSNNGVGGPVQEGAGSLPTPKPTPPTPNEELGMLTESQMTDGISAPRERLRIAGYDLDIYGNIVR